MNDYIVFASWEERFIESAKNDIIDSNIESIYCFYFKDKEFYDRTKPKIEKLEELLKDKDIKLEKIELEFNNYIASWKRVRDTFPDMTAESVILNISTMPRNMIFCMLHFLSETKKEYSTIYYPAGNHGSHPTTNPLKPHIVLQHGGIMYPEKETILVILIGYDNKRAQQLYNYFEPYKVYLGLIDNNFTTTPSDYGEEFGEEFDIPNLEVFRIPNPSHIDILDKLNEILTKETLKKYNVLLCSLGPKIESIGVYKFHKLHPDTALLYAPSKDYADDYSTGINLENPKTVFKDWIEDI